MKYFITLTCVILALVTPVQSAEKTSESKVKIGIFSLESENGNKDLCDKASRVLSTIVNDIGFYTVFDQDMMTQNLGKIDRRMPAHCRDPRCVVSIGKSLQMDRMLYGSIDDNDKRIGVKLTLVDILMSQTIGTVSIEGDPGVSAKDVLTAAVAKLHGTNSPGATNYSKYFGPEVNNKKQLLISSAGFLAAGIIWGALNYVVNSDAQSLVAEYRDDDLSGLTASADQIPMFARPAALANAYTAASDDAYGVLYNPAGIAWVANREAVLAYQYRFGLNNIAASYVNKATREIGFGQALLYSADRDNLFREMYFVSAIAYKFNELFSFMRPFSAGANIKIVSNRVKGTDEGSVSGSSFGVGLDLGLLFELSDQIRYGLNFRDLPVVNRWKNVSTGERYFEANAATLHMGGTFKAGYKTLLIADGQLPLSKDQRWKMAGGIEQEVFKVLLLRIGMQKEIASVQETPWKVTGGFGIRIDSESLFGKALQVDGSYEYNTLQVFDVVNVSMKFAF